MYSGITKIYYRKSEEFISLSQKRFSALNLKPSYPSKVITVDTPRHTKVVHHIRNSASGGLESLASRSARIIPDDKPHILISC